MRNGFIITLFLLTLAPLSHAHEKDQYEEIKLSVVDFLKKGAGSPAGCDVFKEFLAKDPTDLQKKRMMTGFCDGDIDFSKPVSFTEMYSHQVDGESYVCGIISGQTKLSRKIGVRFISAEPYHLILNVKFSRRPIAYAIDDGFLTYSYQSQLQSYNELNSKYCNGTIINPPKQ
ncbi:hypothetical protein [Pantoea agglomerans]|uniref:hypothetical protein n=1 Tax=Enterobacter agglomerans TaxID=549 RepID=UPI003DA080E7